MVRKMGNCHRRHRSQGHMTRLMRASRHQNHALVETILNKEKYIVNRSNYVGNAAIHYCFWQNTFFPRGSRERCLRLLIDAGANVNTVTLSGRTPLMYAVNYSYITCAKFLIDAKADVNTKDCFGQTALHYCVNTSPRHRRNDCVKLLLNASAICDAQTNEGRTPLMLAMQQGDPETCQMLIDAGCDLNRVDLDGCSALHYYFHQTQSFDSFKLLVSRGADINVIDHMDESLFEKALNCLDDKIIQYLIYENCVIRDEDLEGFLKPGFQFKPDKTKEKTIGLLLLACGHSFQDKDVFLDVFDIKDRVFSLKLICRNSIRQLMRSGIGRKVTQVDLPIPLYSYLLMKDLISPDIYKPANVKCCGFD
ncbi:hypothetical protein SNE40_019380 [Patella caerulea]|uniref:Uncharacterized protein n=1 Tax=Patella caerulea TaxID=87958 RepID=A0AAN8JB12_PATCE